MEQAQAGYRQVAKHTQEGLQQAGEVVRANPGMSLSAAFGVGIALGVVIGICVRPSRPHDLASHFHRPSWLSYQAFGITPEETDGRLVYELGNRRLLAVPQK
jgi:hypothetical protein